MGIKFKNLFSEFVNAKYPNWKEGMSLESLELEYLQGSKSHLDYDWRLAEIATHYLNA